LTAAFDVHVSQTSLKLCHEWPILRRVIEGVRQTQYSYLLHLHRKRTSEVDRRSFERFNAQLPIQISPVFFDGENLELLDLAQPFIPAVTNDLTLRGVGFIHQQLLFGDYAVVHCDLLNPGGIALLLSLRWTNVRDNGQFKSGGRFEGLVTTRSLSDSFD
jgi:hypothetical protein